MKVADLWTFGVVMPVVLPLAASAAPFSDDFNGNSLNAAWTVVTPNPDTSVRLNGSGRLKMIASPLNGGSDLYPGPNLNAPMILQPVAPEQNWQIETRLSVNLAGYFQGAGLQLATQPGGFNSPSQVLRLAELQYYGDAVRLCVVGPCIPFAGTKVFMRVKKKGTTYIGYYSQDGKSWVHSGTAENTMPWSYMGLATLRQPWDGNLSLYSSGLFDYFKVTLKP